MNTFYNYLSKTLPVLVIVLFSCNQTVDSTEKKEHPVSPELESTVSEEQSQMTEEMPSDSMAEYDMADTSLSSQINATDTVKKKQEPIKFREKYIDEGTLSNYVPNSGFENGLKVNSCPQEIWDLEGGWMCIQTGRWTEGGHNNYINTCFSPLYKKGEKAPHSGNAFIFYVTSPQQRAYNFFYIELKGSLHKGVKYYAEAYMRIEQMDKKTILPEIPKDAMGFYFTEIDIKPKQVSGPQVYTKVNPNPFHFTPVITLAEGKKIEDFKQWHLVSGTFVAKGGEKALIIGNFGVTSFSAKFILDDIKVIPYSGDLIGLDNIKDAETGQSILLKNIFFEPNKADITQKSHKELDKLSDILKKYPKLVIQIVGYTGFQTITDYDKKLAETRAFSVMMYLLDKGIEMNRMSYKGYNRFDSDTGKTPDRIEIVIIKK